ncbi:hypothetical protein [Methylophilus sp. OH31]|uniref:hypothetical protein n=1 Tax=Methylophilus sp. OH31 TaxID=1387312 RepID=UPI0004BCD972|nr:hypothetical protein [Methylophilus sp. OH31]
MKHVFQNALTLLFTAMVLLSCSTSPPMKVALTEMGTSSRSEYGGSGIKYMRSVTVTGIAPEETIGSISLDSDKFNLTEQLKRINLNPQDLPDTMNGRLSNERSKIFRRYFCIKTECPTRDDIIKIKSAIETQGIYIAKIADAELELKAIQLVKTALNKKSKDEEKELLLNGLKSKLINNSIIQESTVSNYQDKFDQSVQSLKTEIATVQSVLDDTKKSIDKPGILITNWKFESNLNATGSMPGLGASLSKTKDSYGYAIIGNPVVLSFNYGTDGAMILNKILNGQNVKPWICSGLNIFCKESVYFTVFQVRAQQVVYAESLESVVAANLDVKVDDLISTLQPLMGGVDIQSLAKLKVAVAAEFSRYTLSSNRGFIDVSKGDEEDLVDSYDFYNETANKMADLNKIYKKTIPIINSRVSLPDYAKKVKVDGY